MSERDELWWVARQLRAQVEWLQQQGLEAFPQVGAAPSPALARGGAAAARAAAAALADERPVAAVRPAAPVSAPRAAEPASARTSAPSVRAASAALLGGGPAAGEARPAPAPSGLGERRSLALIREELGDCARCKLSGTRHNIVFGVGNPSAELMFVGEGPGHDEDLSGEPFVGAAGKLLTRIIGAMGMSREEVYIANVVKCRPPQNRDPEAEEVAACSPFLFQQIASIQPKVIVALGRPACATLIGAPLTTPISKLRGRFLRYRGQIPIMPTFHPAYLLRTAAAKRDVWEDMKLVVAELEQLTGKKYELAGAGKDA